MVFLLHGCSNDENPAPEDDPIQVEPDPMDGPDPQPEENSVKLAEDVIFGQILTDSEGKTLYFFSLDTKDISACTCADF